MDTREVDLIVIGAGPVGENVADRAVQGGLDVVIVETELVGGECSYWACMPSKALLRPGAALGAAQAVPGAAEAVTGTLNASAVLAWRDAVTSNLDDEGQVTWLESAGIDLIRGHARLTGQKRVVVESADGEATELVARHAVALCTGSVAAIPDLPGIEDIDVWTSREATQATEIPGSLVVLGGGVVGCEMATAFASLGSTVTLVARGELLGSLETFAADAVRAGLEARGVTVLTGAAAQNVHHDGEEIVLTLESGDRIRAERLLVASGRRPRIHDVGGESVGLAQNGAMEVDDTLRVVGTDWLYAVGDVNGRAPLTHQGKYQARAAGDVIAARAAGHAIDDAPWGRHVATADHSAVPQVVFTEPEVAFVGLTARRAADAGIATRVIDYELGQVAGASVHARDYRGRARAVFDRDRRILVGATFVGPDVAELLHAATIAVVGEVPVDRLWHAVPAYPTVSEVWLRWLEAWGRPEEPA